MRSAVKAWAECWIKRLRYPFELEQQCESVIAKIECMYRLAKKVTHHFDQRQDVRDKFLEQMQRALERQRNGPTPHP